MPDYILIRKSRNTLSTILHFLFNALFGISSIFLTTATNSWTLGIFLVILSKWRMFAVRPRYLFLNLKSNLVDLIVGVSFVFITYCSGVTILPIHLFLAVAYTFWLTYLKPLSSPHATTIQALIAVFLGGTAATLTLASANPIFLIVTCAIIGYGASRHVLAQSSDNNFTLSTFIIALLFAEIAWICRSWLVVYSFHSVGVIIPQLALILSLFFFAFVHTHSLLTHHDPKPKLSDLAPPSLFALFIIALIFIWFSNPTFNI